MQEFSKDSDAKDKQKYLKSQLFFL